MPSTGPGTIASASNTRRPQEEPRFAARIDAALGAAQTVVNVGAGTGSYEPRDRHVIAGVEPSDVMAINGHGKFAGGAASAESLPLRDHSVDAAMAILTLHHWDGGQERGVRELRRVATGPVSSTTHMIPGSPARCGDGRLLARGRRPGSTHLPEHRRISAGRRHARVEIFRPFLAILLTGCWVDSGRIQTACWTTTRAT